METCGEAHKGAVEQRTQKAEKEDEGDRTERKNSQEADLWADPGKDQSGRNQTRGKDEVLVWNVQKSKKIPEHLG